MDVSKQMQVTQIMRTELDRIAENNFARKQGLAEGLARGEAKGRAEGRAEGRVEGLAEGRAKGRAEEKRQTAKNFKELGVDLSIIQQATGLSAEDIQAL